MLLAVVGCALVRGAGAGAVIGFCAGLAVDVLPPSAHLVGQYALVLCLVGFMAGRAGERPSPGRSWRWRVRCRPAARGGGRRDARRHQGGGDALATVPLAILYNLLAAPLVVWAATRIVRGHVVVVHR